jgi:Protein of unknown function (DUF3500)
MEHNDDLCPDCSDTSLDRRELIRKWSVGAALAAGLPLFATARAKAAPTRKNKAETAVKELYKSLIKRKGKDNDVCLPWNYGDPELQKEKEKEEEKEKKRLDPRGLLRTYVSNNWQITKHPINSEYFNKKERDLIHEIFLGIINPKWESKFEQQLKDDSGEGDKWKWGDNQSIAIFGDPEAKDKPFEFVMTGRHMTIRADGNTTPNVAFGGPIFYGHAASGFIEKPRHPGNVFFHQAEMANKVYQMISKEQRKKALVTEMPGESEVGFKGPKGMFTGIAVAELATEHKEQLKEVLKTLVEPYRKEDQDEVEECLKKQGGLEKCYLSFYKDSRIDNENWDCWRLEGPAFVWGFRGTPHVHVWVNIADDPKVPLNAKG